MAIQERRGNYADFDASKLVPGEPFVCLDKVNGKYFAGIGIAPSQYMRLGDYDEVQTAVTECEGYADAAEGYKDAAATSATNADTFAETSEAWAVGKKDGVDVPSTDPAYHNNSKYYSEQADTSADNAEDSAEDSEAWAVGTRDGSPVPSTDPAYNNNAKHWAETASAIVGIGIATTTTPGIVKPDGTTITVEADGTIHGAVVGAYHAAGTKTVAELTSSLLIASNEGNVYNMTDSGTTTADFVEGAGKPINVGDNVGVCKIGSDYKFDLLSGFLDTSAFYATSDTAETDLADADYVPFYDTSASGKKKTLWSNIKAKLKTYFDSIYVTAVSGKGLSTNDYDNTAKTKLDGLANIKSVGTGLSLNGTTGELTATGGGGGGTWGSITGTLSDQTDLQTALDGKQATLTFDNVPTNGSNNPVKSDGIYDAINDVYDVMGENGAVNLFNNTGTTTTINGVTWTVNADKTVTADTGGLASTGNSFFDVNCDIPAGDNYFSACPEGGSSDTYGASLKFKTGSPSWSADEIGSGISVDRAISMVRLYVKSGVTASNKVFKPMIAPASYTGDYVPYAQTNQELTKSKMSYADNSVLGAKNLLPFSNTSKTINGITFTVNSDGSVTANGTATGRANYGIKDTTGIFNELNKFGKQKYIMSGCPSGGSSGTYYQYIHPGYVSDAWVAAVYDYGEGVEFEYDGETQLFFSISIMSGVTVSNLTFKPMLRLATDPDDTYVPYAMTNRELTEREVITPTFQTNFSNSSNRTKIIRKGSQIIASFVVLSTGTVTIYDWNNNMLKIEGYGPKKEMFVPFITSDYKTGIVKINPNGMVQLNPSSTFSNQTIFANAVWEINA